MIVEPKPLTPRQLFGFETRTTLQFAAEMFGAALLLLLTRTFLQPPYVHVPAGAPTVALGLLPIIPVWLIPLAMLRHYLRIDELQKQRFLQSVALTAGIMAGLAWSYQIAARVLALPPLSWEFHFSLIFVVVTALLNIPRSVRPVPRA
jgi:hypothetical protein